MNFVARLVDAINCSDDFVAEITEPALQGFVCIDVGDTETGEWRHVTIEVTPTISEAA
jgi:hypothetical protein